MKSLVIDTTATVSEAPIRAFSQTPSRAGLGADILHIIIDGRKLPDNLPSVEQSFPRMPVGHATAARVLKDYVLSCDPYQIKSK